MKLDADFWRSVDALLDLALAEDIGAGDATSLAVVSENAVCQGAYVAREAGVLAGLAVVERAFKKLDARVRLESAKADGEEFVKGDVLARVSGPARSILSGERVSLNIMQRMSGVASQARRYSEAVKGTKASIVDTRKTIPGWRALDKLAVALGGADNHRHGLFDMVLIKDNHIELAKRESPHASTAWAIRTAREKSGLLIQVEVESLAQLREALAEQPDMVLLDNMPPAVMAEAVNLADSLCGSRGWRRPLLEASGGITLATVRAAAESGVDRISVGALTHSVIAIDIGLDLEV